MEKDIGGTLWDALLKDFTTDERVELNDQVTSSRRAHLDAARAAQQHRDKPRRRGRPKGRTNG